jgi:hypothetical protein
MPFNLFIALIASLILLGGLVGLLMIGLSYLRNQKPSRTGISLVALPVCLAMIALIYSGLSQLILSKPGVEDLVGKYHLIKVTVPDFDKSQMKDVSLEFKADGSFSLTTLLGLEDICSFGKYKLDYEFDNNEIQFDCGTFTTFAHIDRGLGSYRIEFIVGDPDLGESYYFEKNK